MKQIIINSDHCCEERRQQRTFFGWAMFYLLQVTKPSARSLFCAPLETSNELANKTSPASSQLRRERKNLKNSIAEEQQVLSPRPTSFPALSLLSYSSAQYITRCSGGKEEERERERAPRRRLMKLPNRWRHRRPKPAIRELEPAIKSESEFNKARSVTGSADDRRLRHLRSGIQLFRAECSGRTEQRPRTVNWKFTHRKKHHRA